MEIVKNGKALCGVVLPDNPTEREIFASEELIRYIEKISGAKLEITENCENKIIIGEPSKNKFAEELMSQEEFEK